MPKSGEFYTFEEVTKQLDIDEQKLKRLVSEGEIRAFREGDEMKFKKSDIDSLNLGATEAETSEIDLSAGQEDASETLTDDLIFDEGDELDLSSDDAGMATAEISSQDTFVDEGGAPVGMSTEPLEFSEEGFDEEMEEETGDEIAVAAGPRARQARPGRRYEQPTGAGDLGWSILLILSILVMLCAGFAVWSASSAKGINSWSAVPVKLFDSKDYDEIVKLHPTLGKQD
ncbi:MAG: helix-turn-helix domain-containing protein [Planctomycetota bacterium]